MITNDGKIVTKGRILANKLKSYYDSYNKNSLIETIERLKSEDELFILEENANKVISNTLKIRSDILKQINNSNPVIDAESIDIFRVSHNYNNKYFASLIIACDFIVEKIIYDFYLNIMDYESFLSWCGEKGFISDIPVMEFSNIKILSVEQKINLIKELYNFITLYLQTSDLKMIAEHLKIIKEVINYEEYGFTIDCNIPINPLSLQIEDFSNVALDNDKNKLLIPYEYYRNETKHSKNK